MSVYCFARNATALKGQILCPLLQNMDNMEQSKEMEEIQCEQTAQKQVSHIITMLEQSNASLTSKIILIGLTLFNPQVDEKTQVQLQHARNYFELSKNVNENLINVLSEEKELGQQTLLSSEQITEIAERVIEKVDKESIHLDTEIIIRKDCSIQ